MPNLSIIVAMHNDEKYIQRCLDSIEKQTNGDFEVICVDDASDDNTISVCESYTTRLPMRIHKIDKNSGLSVVRQQGLMLSKSEYVGFVDADDELSPDYVETVVELLKKAKFDVCLFGVKYVNNESSSESLPAAYHSRTISHDAIEESYEKIVDECHLSDSWDKIYSRNFILESGVHFCMNKGINGSDSLFNKMLFLHNPEIVFLNNVLYIHYSNPNSMVTRTNKDFVQMAITIYEKMSEEAEKMHYQQVKQYIRMLFFAIVRSDLTNKIQNKELFNQAMIRGRHYVLDMPQLNKTVSGHFSVALFQKLFIADSCLLKPYLFCYAKIKKI